MTDHNAPVMTVWKKVEVKKETQQLEGLINDNFQIFSVFSLRHRS